MHVRTESALETRLAEVLMRDLVPCDLGDGIEVIHDVEMIEIEMECDVDDDAAYSAPYERIEIQYEPSAVVSAVDEVSSTAALGLNLNAFVRSAVWDTLPFAPYEPNDLRNDANVPIAEEVAKGSGPVQVSDSAQTVPFARIEADTVPFPLYSAPYERIELVQTTHDEGAPLTASQLRSHRVLQVARTVDRLLRNRREPDRR